MIARTLWALPRAWLVGTTASVGLAMLLAISQPVCGDEPKPSPSENKDSSKEPKKEPEGEKKVATDDRWVQELVKQTRPALAVISVIGRDGRPAGLGTGFVISSDGLIATNLHVIGEGRPIRVELADRRKPKVTAVHAWDRRFDLAILKVDAQDLTALPLGTAAQLAEGEPLVIQGNPHGLTHSVTAGVLSGHREIENRKMLQIAIPIEPGNSGGPALDRQGRVVGIVTMKSSVTNNLGFAVEVEALKGLLEKPNPVSIDRWMTLGALDPQQWTPLFGANWQQRGGRILVEGSGAGFGGRSICLSREKPPELPYEIGVWVKLDDEAGAAGLAMLADGGDKHFGFYPTAGKLRLTRFEGPDVTSWRVLAEEESPHYRKKSWNHIKVRIEAEQIRCFVNDQQVFVHNERDLAKFVEAGGQFGLAKFRQTQAEFKGFQFGETISLVGASSEDKAALLTKLRELPSLDQLPPEKVDEWSGVRGADEMLEEEARALEQKAKELRFVAADLRTRRVCKELEKLADGGVEKVDLLRGSLQIARLDEPDVDVESYVRMVDRMAEEIQRSLPPEAGESVRLDALRRFMYEENGFHGSRTDYYHQANSYMNRVLDDREGLPITLAIVFMELAARIGLKMEGVGLPGHFVVRYLPTEGEPQLLDAFDKGGVMSRADADRLVVAALGEPANDSHYAATDNRAILRRVLSNLFNRGQETRDMEALIRYVSATIAIAPDAVDQHRMLAMLKFETGRHEAAARELEWFFEHPQDGIDVERLRELQQFFRRGGQR